MSSLIIKIHVHFFPCYVTDWSKGKEENCEYVIYVTGSENIL